MLSAGIDMGAKNIKVVILKDNEIVGKAIRQGGLEIKKAAEEAMQEALGKANLKLSDLQHVTSTGSGRKEAPFAQDEITEVGAAARGANFFFASAKTVIEVGAEEGRAVKADGKGRVVDFVVNEKCAAGAGSFTEAMARALELKVEELGRIALESNQTVPMNAQCAVFAESEVVSLIHAGTTKPDIARAVHDAIASRIVSMARRVGVEKDVALIGGLANNPAFVAAMQRGLETDVLSPQEPEFAAAVGAALVAADRA